MKIQIPKTFMGKPVEGALERALAKESASPINETPQPIPLNKPNPASNNIIGKDKYIILPAQNYGSNSYPDLLVSMDKEYNGMNWNQCWHQLKSEDASMLTIRQFVDFLKLLNSGRAFDGNGTLIPSTRLDELYKEITEVRSPWRSEWLDAKFEKKDANFIGLGGTLYLNSHRYDSNGVLKDLSEPLEDCLMQDKQPGISLSNWIDDSNKQGLPPVGITDGSLWYWYPRNGRVARFYASSDRALLNCIVDPSVTYASLGVRLVRKKI